MSKGESGNAVCPRCGAAFACAPDGPCWCRDAPFKLPRTALDAARGCYCPRCLAEIAEEARA